MEKYANAGPQETMLPTPDGLCAFNYFWLSLCCVRYAVLLLRLMLMLNSSVSESSLSGTSRYGLRFTINGLNPDKRVPCSWWASSRCRHVPRWRSRQRQKCYGYFQANMGRVQLVSATNFWSHIRQRSSFGHKCTRGSAPISRIYLKCCTHKRYSDFIVRQCRKCIYHARRWVVNFAKYIVSVYIILRNRISFDPWECSDCPINKCSQGNNLRKQSRDPTGCSKCLSG